MLWEDLTCYRVTVQTAARRYRIVVSAAGAEEARRRVLTLYGEDSEMTDIRIKHATRTHLPWARDEDRG